MVKDNRHIARNQENERPPERSPENRIKEKPVIPQKKHHQKSQQARKKHAPAGVVSKERDSSPAAKKQLI